MTFTHFDPQQLYSARNFLNNKKSELSYHRRKQKEIRKAMKEAKERAEGMKKARIIIQTVAQETQQNLEYHLSYPVTDSLALVFPDAINFVVRFETRRGKTECDLLFEEFGKEYKPMEGSGYGPVDVAAFILRICFWSLNKNRPTLILDEPFRNVSPDLQHKVSVMVKRISEKLGVQIIMVSHAEEINLAADKTFVSHKKGKVTKIEELT